MGNEVNILITATDKASAVLNKANAGVKGLNSAFQSMTGISLGAAGATTAVIAGIKSSIDYTVKYAGQVRDLSRAIGATSEESSRLVQVADDAFVSYESLTTAMKAAITRGYEPTIDGLKRMADQYNAIQDPIQRSKYLVDTFGRSGLEMGKLMELGSQGIEEFGKKAKNIMTADDIARAERYRQAMDGVEDSLNGVKIAVAESTMPTLTTVAEGLEISTSLWKQLKDTVSQAGDKLGGNWGKAARISLAWIESGIPGVYQEWKALNKELDKTPEKMRALQRATENANQELMRQTDYMYKLVSYMAGLKDKTYTITQILRFYSNTGSSGNIMTGAGGGGSNMKAAYANAFGGSYKIPAAFGFEGASPAPGLTASGGERVTVTPEGQDQEVVFADKSLRRLALMIRDITLTRV